MTKIVWLQARCPICKGFYDYPEGGYKPKTCGKFDCLHAYLHPELQT